MVDNNPILSVLIDDRKRGHVCRLLTSGTSPAYVGPHRLIIANHEKLIGVSSPFMREITKIVMWNCKAHYYKDVLMFYGLLYRLMIEIDAGVGEKTYVSYEDINKCEYTIQVLCPIVLSAVVWCSVSAVRQ